MAVVSGRGSHGRTVTVTTTNASTALTAPAGTFDTARDVGRPITGVGIPAAATLTAVASATAATLSAAATAAGTVDATLGAHLTPAALRTDEEAYGFRGWSPETPAEALTYQLTGLPGAPPGVNEPSRVTNPNVGRDRRDRRR
jgi:hypothetical protein